MKPEEATLRRLYLGEQKSLAEIGLIYGKDRQQIRRWLMSYDIPRRTVREGTMISGKFGVQGEDHREALRRGAAKSRAKITPESRAKQAAKTRGREAWNRGKAASDATRALLVAQRADPEYRRRQSERLLGEKSPLWKGGIKPEHSRRLDRAEWRRIRRECYERDGWMCRDCGCRCLNSRDSKLYPKRKIQAHHLVARRDGGSDDLSNLVTLCMSCHHKRERSSVAPS